jgi:hypothetical protein
MIGPKNRIMLSIIMTIIFYNWILNSDKENYSIDKSIAYQKQASVVFKDNLLNNEKIEKNEENYRKMEKPISVNTLKEALEDHKTYAVSCTGVVLEEDCHIYKEDGLMAVEEKYCLNNGVSEEDCMETTQKCQMFVDYDASVQKKYMILDLCLNEPPIGLNTQIRKYTEECTRSGLNGEDCYLSYIRYTSFDYEDYQKFIRDNG